MTITTHTISAKQFAEIITDEVLVASAEAGLDLLGNIYYQGFDGIILYEKNIIPAFFDLKTGMAGEVLQKFSNYRMQLAIIGEFDKYESNALHDFILESNKAKQVLFVASLHEALNMIG